HIFSLNFFSKRKSNSISSNVFPFVSGTKVCTNHKLMKQIIAKNPNVKASPKKSVAIGKKNDNKALQVHKNNVHMPIAIPLIRSGKISASKTQATIPQVVE